MNKIYLKEFLTNPKVEFLPDGRRIRLLEDFTYKYDDKQITALCDFICNGGSIPKLFWPIISSPFTSKYRNAYIIHDWLCEEYKKLPKSEWVAKRLEADQLLLRMCKEVGGIKPYAIYVGVRIGSITVLYHSLKNH